MRRFVRHPGEVLACFLDECQVSQNRLARSMGVPPRRINEILHDWELEQARRRREERPRKPTSDLGHDARRHARPLICPTRTPPT
jgi:hypothetical protein